LPALALSEVVLKLSWPSGLAAKLKAPAGEAGAAVEDVVADVDVDVDGAAVVPADVGVEEVVLLDFPQPPSTTKAIANASSAMHEMGRNFARSAP
jgi:hypothetical protein